MENDRGNLIERPAPPRAAVPAISRLLVAVTWLEVLVLVVAGGGLLVAHPAVVGVWPWSLAPFNLRFLGAIYVAALVAAAAQALIGRWSPARTITAMIFAFTLIVTAGSVVHRDRFDAQAVPSGIWFALYVGVCANAGWHLVRYRRWPAAGGRPGRFATRLLLGQAIVLGAVGVAMLAAPALVGRLWAWPIDAFHAQLYSATLLTPAVAALSLRRGATRADWLAIGLTQVAWGVLPIVALVHVDAGLKRLDWSTAVVQGWVGLFGLIALAGAWMVAQATRRVRGTNAFVPVTPAN